jgi:hypothetical protein
MRDMAIGRCELYQLRLTLVRLDIIMTSLELTQTHFNLWERAQFLTILFDIRLMYMNLKYTQCCADLIISAPYLFVCSWALRCANYDLNKLSWIMYPYYGQTSLKVNIIAAL